MNITTSTHSLPLATVVNPQTDSLRRENNNREVITKPAAASQSAAEKGLASDKDKAKTPGQNNEHVDFATIRKNAEKENSSISDSSEEERNPEHNSERNSEQKQQETSESEQGSAEIVAQEKEIHKLKQRDLEVRTHERAHAATGGVYTGSPQYTFEQGPDGKKYAVGGEVSVDLSSVSGNPRATIAKMQKVHAAALAPADPSVQDTKVAAKAAILINQAQAELFFDEKPRSGSEVENSDDTFDQGLSSKQKGSAENRISEQFDLQMNKTLEAQEQISPKRSDAVTQRAVRVESFYSNITQAYEKPPRYQFQLTA